MTKSGLDPEQFRRLVIRPTLLDMELHSIAAERLLLGTALVESKLRYLTQHNGGPAKGVYQTEPATARDLYTNWLYLQKHRWKWVEHLANFQPIAPNSLAPGTMEYSLVSSLAYATGIARMIYYRRPEALPDPENLWGMARYWKDFYNTKEGDGDPAKFVAILRPLWHGPVVRDEITVAPAPALRPSTPMPPGFRFGTPPQWTRFLQRYPDQEAKSAARVQLTGPRLRELSIVSAHVRKACPYKRDPESRDFWRIMIDGEEGDCEDGVLSVRARLAGLGWPLGALRPTICKTPQGIGHMVLCIHTKGQGVYVRDNLFDHIAPWEPLPYQWFGTVAGKYWQTVLPKQAA